MKNRILIVEDDHAISDALALNMQFVGYEYAVFDDGKRPRIALRTITLMIWPCWISCCRASTALNCFPTWRNTIFPSYT